MVGSFGSRKIVGRGRLSMEAYRLQFKEVPRWHETLSKEELMEIMNKILR